MLTGKKPEKKAKQAVKVLPKVTKFHSRGGRGTLTAPEGYRASVLVRCIGSDDVKGTRTYAQWALAGRESVDFTTVKFSTDGTELFRIDVPERMSLDADTLERLLQDAHRHDVSLPPDTPIIKR